MAVSLEIEVVGLESLMARIARFGDVGLQRQAKELVGGLVESQTRLRFQTATDPDGNDWAPWSPGYAESRHKGHSLLQASNALLDSIAWRLDGEELTVGSNIVYAAIHQFGGEEGMRPGPAAIPARPYLGVNSANAAELERELADWLAGVLQ